MTSLTSYGRRVSLNFFLATWNFIILQKQQSSSQTGHRGELLHSQCTGLLAGRLKTNVAFPTLQSVDIFFSKCKRISATCFNNTKRKPELQKVATSCYGCLCVKLQLGKVTGGSLSECAQSLCKRRKVSYSPTFNSIILLISSSRVDNNNQTKY